MDKQTESAAVNIYSVILDVYVLLLTFRVNVWLHFLCIQRHFFYCWVGSNVIQMKTIYWINWWNKHIHTRTHAQCSIITSKAKYVFVRAYELKTKMNWCIENGNISLKILLFSHTKIDERKRICRLSKRSENKKKKQQTSRLIVSV